MADPPADHTPPPRLRGKKLVVRYAAFAAVAVLVNLGTQAIVFAVYDGPWDLEMGLVAGTATGLLTKFILDKYWIFFDVAPQGLTDHGRQFFLYTLMGVATTFLFWGTEYLFDRLIGGDVARLTGGAIGLTAGYILKYQLDRMFVFRSAKA